jgi:RNA polymerase sigma factor (sigma-70 family)
MTEPAAADDLRPLMVAAQRGDARAYVELLQEVTVRLRRVIRRQRRFLGVDEVEDLVQDVLLSVHTVRATFDPERPFMPWLLAITRNRLADGARRYARGAAHEIQVDDLDVTFALDAANPQDDEYGDPEALRRAVASLPRGQRDAIQMLKLDGMSLKEAAAARGTTVAALKVATHRAMKTLKERLTKR